MQQLIAIALGGSAGAVMRFLVANGIYAALGRSFPYGTLFINVSGSLLMGFLTELVLHRFALASEYRAAILVGFLGAYTTFSTFSLETIYLFEAGNHLKVILNIFLSVALCLVACWIGLVWGRSLFSEDLSPGLGYDPALMALLFSFSGTFIVSLVAEILFQYFNIGAQVRSAFFILLLGGLTLSSTLWLTFKPPAIHFEFQGLLSIFAITTLFGVAMVWLGSWIGNWLWQLKLSQ
jgi:fluoride exporter